MEEAKSHFRNQTLQICLLVSKVYEQPRSSFISLTNAEEQWAHECTLPFAKIGHQKWQHTGPEDVFFHNWSLNLKLHFINCFLGINTENMLHTIYITTNILMTQYWQWYHCSNYSYMIHVWEWIFSYHNMVSDPSYILHTWHPVLWIWKKLNIQILEMRRKALNSW